MTKYYFVKYFRVIADNGKPHEKIVFSREELFIELQKLKDTADDSPYCDVFIFNEEEIDITEDVFKDFNKYKGL